MKKYDVFDLYVILVDDKYFICENHGYENYYREIFTRQKIHDKDIKYKESLSNYYSILAVANYTTGKHMKLAKKDLLHEYILINDFKKHPKHLTNNFKDTTEEKCREAIRFYILATKLKYKIRSGWDKNHWNINSDRLESVAEHVYGTCILAISIYSEFNFDEIDLNRVLKMLTIHEIGEVLIGDITPFDNVTPEQKASLEHQAMSDVLGNLSDKEELLNLLLEFDEGKTADSKFAYYCDKLEADIQSKVYQDKGLQRSLEEQKDNIVFNNPKIKQMIKNGFKTPFDIWYENDKDKFIKSPKFTKVLKYIKDNNLNM